MNSSELTAAQAQQIHGAIFPGINYLARLIDRMGKAGFPPDEPLYPQGEEPYDAAQELYVAVHYLGCNGVGKPATK